MAKSRARKLADIIVGAGVDIDGNLTFDGGSTSEDLTFADGDKANFGDASDLQIYHDGSNSYITDSGTGNLRISGTLLQLNDASFNKYFLGSGSIVRLYYADSEKLQTTSSGVSITGSMVATSAIVDNVTAKTSSGSITFKNNSGSDKMRLTDAGNLGIGTNSPTEPLTVSETSSGNTMQVASFVNPVGTANTGVRLWLSGTNTTTRGTFIDAVAESTANNHSLRFGTSASSSAPTERMRIDASGNLGLGTTSPNSYTNYTALTINGTNGGLLDFETNGTFVGEVWGDGTNGLALQAVGSRYIRFLTNGGERMRIDADGDVGIGTTSPQTRFHVDSSDGSGIRVSRSGSSAYLQLFPAYSNVPTIMGLGAGGLHLGYNSSTAGIRIHTNNNIGIGVTSPTSILDIRGSGDADVMSKIINTGQTTNGRKTEFLFGKDNGANLSGVLKYVYNSTQASRRIDLVHYQTTNGISILDGGNVGIGTTSPSANLEVENSSGATIMVDDTNGRFIKIRSANSGSQNANISSYSGLYLGGSDNASHVLISNSGNVGINSTIPNQKLYVNGIIGSVNEAQGSGQLQLQGYGNAGFINMNGTGNLNFRMGSSYTTLMTLTAAGRLGIGTTAPSNQLVVKSGTNVDMEFGSESGGGFIQTYNRSTPGYGYLRFITNGETMRLTNTGNVGIGNTNPTTGKLVIGGNANQYTLRIDASGTSGQSFGARIRAGTSSSDFGLLVENTSATGMFAVRGDGNVGIATTSPRATLDVRGGHSSTVNEAISFGRTDDDYRYNSIYSRNTSSTNSYLSFRIHDGGSSVAQTETMVIAPGKVGIGTASPDSTLDVHGNTHLGSNNIGAQYTTTLSGFSVTANGSDYYGSYGSLILNSNQNYTSASRPYMITNALKANKFAIISGTDATTDPTIGQYGNITSGSARLVIDNAGNVGIGTDSPGHTLDILRSTNGDAAIKVKSTAAGDPTLLFDSAAANRNAVIRFMDQGSLVGGRIQYVHNGDRMDFQAGSSTGASMSILNNKVGIGTTTPPQQLSVRGTILKTRSDSDTGLIYLQNDGSNNGNIVINQNAGVTRVKLDSAGDSYFNGGNVGIGTTAPYYKLDVYGTDDVTMRIHRPSSGLGNNDTCGIGFSHRGDANTSTSDTRAGIFSTYNGSLFLATEPGGDLNSNPMDHAALMITGTNQNIGINDIQPDRKVSIIGDDTSTGKYPLSLDATDTDYTLEFRRNGQSEWWIKQAGSSFNIHENGVADHFRILAGGQIGIGTTSVDTNAGVEIATTAPNTGVTTLRLTNAVNNKGQRIDFEDDNAARCFTLAHDNGSNIAYMGTLVNEDFAFYAGSAERLRLTYGGAIHCKESGNNGDYTMYIGSVNPGGSGNRYAHVQINTDGGEMFWVEAIGYDYIQGGSIYGRAGGYVYNYANQTDVYSDSIHGDIVALYQNTSGRVEIVIDLTATQTNNRWGSVVLRGGCDTITTSAPLEIIQYSYTSTTAKVY